VPAASSWGVVVLMLLLLAGGTLVLRSAGAYAPNAPEPD